MYFVAVSVVAGARVAIGVFVAVANMMTGKERASRCFGIVGMEKMSLAMQNRATTPQS